MVRVVRLVIVLAAWLGASAIAQAGSGEALRLYGDAQEADGALRFADALRLYRASFASDPSSPGAPRSRARAEDLAGHAEGDFAPLARLEAVRRDPARANDPAAIAALEADAAAFPPGRVRVEARMLVGGAWLGRLQAPARALAPLRAVLDDPLADTLTRSIALKQLTDACSALGDLDAARAAVLAHPDLAPALRSRVLRTYRRRYLRGGAIALVAAVLVAGALSAIGLARRGGIARLRAVVTPVPVVIAAWLAIAGTFLVHVYDEGDPRPFLWLGAGALVVAIASRTWALASSPSRSLRVIRAIACGLAALAVAFLALDHSDPLYLDSFNL